MARPVTGQVVIHERKQGRVYALRFRAYGERQYITLGTETEGWDRKRAEAELEHELAKVRAGVWRAPHPEPAPRPSTDPSFHEFASEWFEAKRREIGANTTLDYEWQLTHHLLPFFARHRLSQITIAEIDRYRNVKLRDGQPSAESINKTITRLAQILAVAVEYELIVRNPAKGKRRHAKTTKPRRSYLDTAEQISTLLSAAGELDSEARSDRQHVHRRAALSTLTLAGLRLGELLDLRWRDVDLDVGRRRVGSKTEASRRDVTIRPALRDGLTVLKAAGNGEPDAYVFGTSNGRRQGATNVRKRVLAPAVKRANQRLAERHSNPLPDRFTAHSLRRTFASALYAIGEDPPTVMAEMGHTTPGLALAIYAQAMRRSDGEKARLRALVEGAEWAPMGPSGDSSAADASFDEAFGL